jgi:hypothetical protein
MHEFLRSLTQETLAVAHWGLAIDKQIVVSDGISLKDVVKIEPDRHGRETRLASRPVHEPYRPRPSLRCPRTSRDPPPYPDVDFARDDGHGFSRSRAQSCRNKAHRLPLRLFFVWSCILAGEDIRIFLRVTGEDLETEREPFDLDLAPSPQAFRDPLPTLTSMSRAMTGPGSSRTRAR